MSVNFSDQTSPIQLLFISDIKQMKENPIRSPSSGHHNPKNINRFKKYENSFVMSELAFSAKDYIEKLNSEKQLIDLFHEKQAQAPPPSNFRKSLSPIQRLSSITRKSRISIVSNKTKKNDPKIVLKEDELKENTYNNYILLENFASQPEIVLEYLLGKTEKNEKEKKIEKKWIQALTKDERGSLYHETAHIYGWDTKYLSPQKIKNDIDAIYGKKSDNRRLKPGEEASVMEEIRKYLERCEKEPKGLQLSINSKKKWKLLCFIV